MLKDRAFFGRKTDFFTLQWHLTNDCGSHCRHCYDRSRRAVLSLAGARGVLKNFTDFCSRNRVRPRISLSGGDPLLYPHFWELYESIAEAGIASSILGNPVPRGVLERLIAIQRPLYYQVSLEGLRAYNDGVRGKGHFSRTMRFLDQARGLGVSTHVMLTLARGNMEQVIQLGQELKGMVMRFTFNRMSQVGEAASVEPPARNEYRMFLESYLSARRHNPHFGLKDNLINIILKRRVMRLSSGCTGFGCGAAFNFVALLPDGELHACRKFPSLIGDVARFSFEELYFSEAAKKYRRRPVDCRGCALHRSCGGCFAVAYGQGLDPMLNRDPHCFIADGEDFPAASPLSGIPGTRQAPQL